MHKVVTQLAQRGVTAEVAQHVVVLHFGHSYHHRPLHGGDSLENLVLLVLITLGCPMVVALGGEGAVVFQRVVPRVEEVLHIPEGYRPAYVLLSPNHGRE